MRGRWVATAAAAVLVAGGTTVGTVVASRSGEALPGTTVADTDVSGQDRVALRRTVEALAASRTSGTLTVTADDTDVDVDRGLLLVDVDATVELALQAGRSGGLGVVLDPLTGGGEALELVASVDRAALTREVEALAGQVDRAVDDGGFRLKGVTATARPPVTGRTVDTDATAELVFGALRSGAPSVQAPVAATAPTTTAKDAQAVTAAATAALAGPYVLGTGNVVLRVTPAQLAPLLSAVSEAGTLALRVDPAGLKALVERGAEPLEVGAREAGFRVRSAPPVVTEKGNYTWSPRPAKLEVLPGAAGREIDVEATVASLTTAVVAGDRGPAPLPTTVVEPDLTTAGARAAGVRTLIGSFTTVFSPGAPRARNIRRIAELVDGSYVAPGDLLSLNDAAGQRTLRRGFVADGAIVDGELKNEVGGGVSQFATTLFNAAFFAGLPIPEHKPHSFYIGRYPAGRESTVYFGAIDVKVRNDTAHGLLVQTSSTPGSVTVSLYGDNGGRTVTSTTGPRRPRDDGGFRIAVTRTVRGGDGVSSRRVFSTSYDPVPPDRR